MCVCVCVCERARARRWICIWQALFFHKFKYPTTATTERNNTKFLIMVSQCLPPAKWNWSSPANRTENFLHLADISDVSFQQCITKSCSILKIYQHTIRNYMRKCQFACNPGISQSPDVCIINGTEEDECVSCIVKHITRVILCTINIAPLAKEVLTDT